MTNMLAHRGIDNDVNRRTTWRCNNCGRAIECRGALLSPDGDVYCKRRQCETEFGWHMAAEYLVGITPKGLSPNHTYTGEDCR